jgi:succinate dehydrogenase/fumarate reductase-like Fe-S protein
MNTTAANLPPAVLENHHRQEGTKISHLGYLPQGQVERERRALALVQQMNIEGFATCTNIGECEAACPKEIKLEVIGRTNCDYIKAASWSARNSQAAMSL